MAPASILSEIPSSTRKLSNELPMDLFFTRKPFAITNMVHTIIVPKMILFVK
jgi:hypothetical protein